MDHGELRFDLELEGAPVGYLSWRARWAPGPFVLNATLGGVPVLWGRLAWRSVVAPPYGELTPPPVSSCGWPAPTFDPLPPPAFVGGFPDGVLVDTCGEAVRMSQVVGHDRPTVLVFAEPEGNEGVDAAVLSGTSAFIDELASEGIDVQVVYVLGPVQFGDLVQPVLGAGELVAWKAVHGVTAPVLADRGSILGPNYLWFETEMTLSPLFVVFDGDGVMRTFTGVQSWDEVARLVRREVAPR